MWNVAVLIFYGHSFYFELCVKICVLSSSDSANTPRMLPPLDIPFEYWIVDCSSYLRTPLGHVYSSGELQALQLIVFAVFGAVD